MSDRLPERINPYRSAGQGRVLEGSYPLELMPRLAESVLGAPGEARVRLAFSKMEGGSVLLEGSIKATLSLTCQRCLSAMDYSVDSELRLVVVPDDARAAQLQEEYDTLVVEEELFVRDLLEDELMLALPLIPRHETPEECDEVARSYLHKEHEHGSEQEGKKENPFSVLEQLKTKH